MLASTIVEIAIMKVILTVMQTLTQGLLCASIVFISFILYSNFI